MSAVASVVTGLRPRPLPRGVGLAVPQVNLRTYVRHETRPGVHFLSLDTTSRLGVRLARAAYGLPYYRARIDVERDGEEIRFHARRNDDVARFGATYRPSGDAVRPAPDSLSAFLAERYRAYLVRGDAVWCTRVDHPPWRLAPAEATVAADPPFEAAGLAPPAEDPVVRYTPGTEMTVRTPFRP